MTMTSPNGQALPPYLVLYDGECGLCQKTVRWLLQRDTAGALRFAPLQGKTSARLRNSGVPVPVNLDSVAFVLTIGGETRVLDRSRAILKICEVIGLRPWWIRVLGIVPRPFADAGYRLVAATRYVFFRRVDACALPSAEERDRFLP